MTILYDFIGSFEVRYLAVHTVTLYSKIEYPRKRSHPNHLRNMIFPISLVIIFSVNWMRLIVKHWKIISQNRRKENSKRSVTNLWLHSCLRNYLKWLIWWIGLKCIKNQIGDVIRLLVLYSLSWYVFWWFWSSLWRFSPFYIEELRNRFSSWRWFYFRLFGIKKFDVAFHITLKRFSNHLYWNLFKKIRPILIRQESETDC